MKIIRKPTESKKGAQLSVLVKLLYKKQNLRVDGIFWVQFQNTPNQIILKCLCYNAHVFCRICLPQAYNITEILNRLLRYFKWAIMCNDVIFMQLFK
jgi:hypothetical protein